MSNDLPYAIEEYEDFHEGTQQERAMVRVTGLETGRVGTMRKNTFEHIQKAYADAGDPEPLKHACSTVVYSAEKNAESSAEHVLHVWINGINPWGDKGEPMPLSALTHRRELYEWKSAMEEVRRLPYWLTRARTGTLPTEHKQCSRSPVEQLPENHLRCALGVDVLECPILRSFYETWNVEGQRKFSNRDLTPEHADALAAKICVWHIYTRAIETARSGGHIDTSEGYMQDEDSRQYWSTVYSHLSMANELDPV